MRVIKFLTAKLKYPTTKKVAIMKNSEGERQNLDESEQVKMHY